MPDFICSKGDNFRVIQEDRSYKGQLLEALKVDGGTGTVTICGQVVTGNAVVANPNVTTITASGLTIPTALSLASVATTGNVGVGGNLTVTGTTTLAGKTPMTGKVYSIVQDGRNGAGALTLTGAKVGDTVVAIADLTTPGDLQSSFETTVSVAGQIQQSSASNLSAVEILFVLHTP